MSLASIVMDVVVVGKKSFHFLMDVMSVRSSARKLVPWVPRSRPVYHYKLFILYVICVTLCYIKVRRPFNDIDTYI